MFDLKNVACGPHLTSVWTGVGNKAGNFSKDGDSSPRTRARLPSPVLAGLEIESGGPGLGLDSSPPAPGLRLDSHSQIRLALEICCTCRFFKANLSEVGVSRDIIITQECGLDSDSNSSLEVNDSDLTRVPRHRDSDSGPAGLGLDEGRTRLLHPWIFPVIGFNLPVSCFIPYKRGKAPAPPHHRSR
jgi:hypothetical protein